MASKFFPPEESWTGSDAWWIQVPLTAIERGDELHFLCQAARRGNDFRYLRLPASNIGDRLGDFAKINDTHVNLFLDAGEDCFIDRRGTGAVSFARFEVR